MAGTSSLSIPWTPGPSGSRETELESMLSVRVLLWDFHPRSSWSTAPQTAPKLPKVVGISHRNLGPWDANSNKWASGNCRQRPAACNGKENRPGRRAVLVAPCRPTPPVHTLGRRQGQRVALGEGRGLAGREGLHISAPWTPLARCLGPKTSLWAWEPCKAPPFWYWGHQHVGWPRPPSLGSVSFEPCLHL